MHIGYVFFFVKATIWHKAKSLLTQEVPDTATDEKIS